MQPYVEIHILNSQMIIEIKKKKLNTFNNIISNSIFEYWLEKLKTSQTIASSCFSLPTVTNDAHSIITGPWPRCGPDGGPKGGHFSELWPVSPAMNERFSGN